MSKNINTQLHTDETILFLKKSLHTSESIACNSHWLFFPHLCYKFFPSCYHLLKLPQIETPLKRASDMSSLFFFFPPFTVLFQLHPPCVCSSLLSCVSGSLTGQGEIPKITLAILPHFLITYPPPSDLEGSSQSFQQSSYFSNKFPIQMLLCRQQQRGQSQRERMFPGH